MDEKDTCGCCDCHDDIKISKSKQEPKSNATRNQIIQFVIGTLLFIAALVIETPEYIPNGFYGLSYLLLGWNVIFKAITNLAKGKIFDENFLMTVATAGALAIGEYPEAVAVMLFYTVGEFLQGLAVRRSKRSISELMDIRPDFANIMENGELVQAEPDSVKIGDIIIVKPGERIPLDGIVTQGESMLDTKALTGESAPRSAMPSDTVLSGCINLSGVLTIEVTKEYGESTAAKIIDLVENASSKKAPTENFITTFSKRYTPIVVGLAVLLAVLPPLLFSGEWSDWIHRALVFLVISCPCALVLSIPLGFFGGIGGASRSGILVKGGNFLEALCNLDIVVFDKTGTLTKGVFEVASVTPADGYAKEKLLELAANAEAFSNHPIALSIRKAYEESKNGAISASKDILTSQKEHLGFGVSVVADGVCVLAGSDKLMEQEGIAFTESASVGTKVYVAVDGNYAGCIVISDESKPDSREAIDGLKELGVRKTVMLTGDNQQTAQAIAKELSIDEVFAQLLPDQKVEQLEALDAQKLPKRKLAFVGDGINDAPVLARADVGIAMGALGSDAAIEAADVVLMTDEPLKLITAVKIAKKTKHIVVQNIALALGIKGIILVLGALGISGMWEAVFADVGVSILAVFNALRALRL